MRDDMYKVIVERPRRGWVFQGDGRHWRNSPERGSHLGMKRGYQGRKWLNENLAPLRRWLHKQAHRPWDKVYSELSQGIDRRNTVQAHIYAHIDQFVAREVQWVDGELVVRRGWGSAALRVPLREAHWVDLFVHPVTGILLPNRLHRSARQAPPRRVVIDDWTQWHRIDGQWFELALDLLPPVHGPSPRRWDALGQCWLVRGKTPPPGQVNRLELLGRPNLYVVSKRLLGSAEIRRRFPNGMPQ